VNFLTEISSYAWDRAGDGGAARNAPPSWPTGPNHLMDAMRYAMEGVQCGDVFGW
jgi:hypothetical protein